MSSEPRSKKPVLFTLIAITAVVAMVGAFVYLEFRGPRPTSDATPPVQLHVTLLSKPGTVIEPGSPLPRTDALSAQVTLERATRVSLVHIDVGHGMETLVLNEPMGPGTHTFTVDGGAVTVSLSDMSGPQVLAAVAADRPLIKDEALSAGRGTRIKAVGVAAFNFTVAP